MNQQEAPQEELKPCPWCPPGTTLSYHHGRGAYLCRGCGCSGPATSSPDTAKIAWNLRTPTDETKLAAERDALLREAGDFLVMHTVYSGDDDLAERIYASLSNQQR